MPENPVLISLTTKYNKKALPCPCGSALKQPIIKSYAENKTIRS
jgi:hypothetical protein